MSPPIDLDDLLVGDRPLEQRPQHSIVLPPRTDVSRHCKNGDSPQAETFVELNTKANHVLRYRRKLVFAAGGGYDANGTSGTSPRFRFRCHTGIKCWKLAVTADIQVAEGTGAMVNGYVKLTATPVGGGSAVSCILRAGAGIVGRYDLKAPEVKKRAPGYVEVQPNTTYECLLEHHGYAVLESVAVYEESDLSNYIPEAVSVDGPITDDMIARLHGVATEALRYNASHLFNFSESTAVTNNATTAKNLFDASVTSVSATSPGFFLNLEYCNTASKTTVPCVFAAHLSRTTSNGTLTLKNSAGATLATLTATSGTAAWYSTTVSLPASLAKYDLHLTAGAAGTVSVLGISLYRLDEVPAGGAVTLVSIDVTPNTPSVVAGATQQMTATGTYSDASTADITGSVTWSSGTPANATISAGGLVTGVSIGTSVITATDPTTLVAGTETVAITTSATADATSGKYAPATAAQWTSLDIAAPAHLYLCQEASGNLADSIGSMTLTAGGTVTYQQAIAGWTRKGVGFSGSTQRFIASAGTGPNPSSQSVAWLVYGLLTSTLSTARAFFGVQSDAIGANTIACAFSTGGLPRIQSNNTATQGSSDVRGQVRPMLIVHNRTAGTVKLFTDQEVVSGSYYGAVVDGAKGLGALVGGSGVTGNILLSAVWTGADAEAFSTNANTKTMLQALGFTIPWS